jgi:hypothetical protein
LAGWATKLIGTKVTLGGFMNRLLSRIIKCDRAARIANFYHLDVAVRAAVRAGAAAYACQIVNAHGPPGRIAANRARGTTDHAHGIGTVHTRMGDQQWPMPLAVANKARVILMRSGTRPHTVVATSAAFKVNEHRLNAIHQAPFDKEFQKWSLDLSVAAARALDGILLPIRRIANSNLAQGLAGEVGEYVIF